MAELTEDELKTFNRLRNNIGQKRKRNELRTRLFDAKKTIDQFGISIPPPMREFATVLGWPAKAVDTPARRIRPDGFTARVETDLFDEVAEALADPWTLSIEKLAIQASLKHSCSFAFTSKNPDTGGALVTAASALDASAVLDPRTGRTLSALERVEDGWMLYLPGKTILVQQVRGRATVVDRTERAHERVTCTVYTWGRTIDRPFGRSRITRPLIGLTDMGVRVLLRQEVSAEFFSSPQRWMLGASQDQFQDETGRVLEAWESIIGGVLAMPDLPIEEEQDPKLRRVEVGQFPQMSMQPHSDHMRTVAMAVSSETSLPLSYLGIVQDNPPSAEAIRAAEADMVSIVEDELDWYRASRANLARDVAAVIHEEWTPAMAKDLEGIRAEFRDPSTATKSAEGDWAVKLVTAFPWLSESETMLRLIFSEQVAKQLLAERRRSSGPGVLSQLLERANTPAAAAPESDAADLKARFDALGVAIRSGVDPGDAASRLGLAGVKFTGAVPVSLRMPEAEAAGLEE